MPTYTYSGTYSGPSYFNYGTYWTDAYYTSSADMYSTSSYGAVYTANGDKSLRIDGEVGGYYYGALMQGGENEISIGQNGSLYSNLYDALLMSGGDNTLLNQGDISGGRYGVHSQGNDSEIDNRGTITGSTGVVMNVAEGGELENSGYIMGNGSNGSSNYAMSGVYSNVENVVIRNLANGTIESTAEDGSGVALGYNSDEALIENFGMIRADEGYGVNFEEVGRSETATLWNEGTIEGGEAAFMGSEGDDTVINRGEMVGDVLLDEGDDVYRAVAGGEVDGVIDGGEDNDLLIGSRFADEMRGGTGNDTLRGKGGEDELDGGDGWDVIKAGRGDDTVYGSAGEDRLLGNGGHDDIDGGSGADTINGGNGNDTMTGGSHRDVFIFSKKSGDDRITDFGNGADQLDLRALDVDSFSDLQRSGAIDDFGGGTMIDLTEVGGNGSIYLQGVDSEDLSGSDFIF